MAVQNKEEFVQKISVIMALLDFANKLPKDKQITMEDIDSFVNGLTAGNKRAYEYRAETEYYSIKSGYEATSSVGNGQELPLDDAAGYDGGVSEPASVASYAKIR